MKAGTLENNFHVWIWQSKNSTSFNTEKKTVTDPKIDGDEYIQHQIFSIFSSLLYLLAPFPQPTPCNFPKERGKAIISEQPQSSFSRAGQPRWKRLHRRAALSARVCYCLPEVLGFCLTSCYSDKYPPLSVSTWSCSRSFQTSPFCSSSVLLSAAVHAPYTGFRFGKTPKMTHTEAPSGKRRVQGCNQPSNFSLLIPGAGEGSKAPPHHCSCPFSPLLGLQPLTLR